MLQIEGAISVLVFLWGHSVVVSLCTFVSSISFPGASKEDAPVHYHPDHLCPGAVGHREFHHRHNLPILPHSPHCYQRNTQVYLHRVRVRSGELRQSHNYCLQTRMTFDPYPRTISK